MLDKSRRYWLFWINSHYPNGGMSDYVGASDTLHDIKEYVDSEYKRAVEGGEITYVTGCWEIYDSETGTYSSRTWDRDSLYNWTDWAEESDV